VLKPCVDRLFVVFVYVYMYNILVRLSVSLNHIKGTIIIIIILDGPRVRGISPVGKKTVY